MRYTTIIDITQQPAVYRNINCRLLYLHLCLMAGYHDNDRDLCHVSIRQLAAQIGLTISAVRHALRILSNAKLVTLQPSVITVSKWTPGEAITARPKTKREATQQQAALERQRAAEARQEDADRTRQERLRLRQSGKTTYMAWYEDLQAKAAAGDIEAQQAVRRHRATYEAQRQQLAKDDRHDK